MFLKNVFYVHQGCIYLIRNTVKLLQFKIMCNVIYSCDGEAEIFTIITHVFSVT